MELEDAGMVEWAEMHHLSAVKRMMLPERQIVAIKDETPLSTFSVVVGCSNLQRCARAGVRDFSFVATYVGLVTFCCKKETDGLTPRSLSL